MVDAIFAEPRLAAVYDALAAGHLACGGDTDDAGAGPQAER